MLFHATISSYVGFEVFTAVVMKSIIFWDMMPCSPLSCARRFGGTYRLHLQDRRNRFSKPANKQKPQLNGLHGVISQKMILFNFILYRQELNGHVACKTHVFLVRNPSQKGVGDLDVNGIIILNWILRDRL
jgi:hypothetical protein